MTAMRGLKRSSPIRIIGAGSRSIGFSNCLFGKGRRWFNDNKWADYAIGGWQLHGLFEGQSARALGFGNAIARSDLRDIVLPVGERTSERWFNLDAAGAGFGRKTPRRRGVHGHTARANKTTAIHPLSSRFSFIRADGTNNFDLSIFKNFRVSEGVKIQLRAESFNAPNNVRFAATNTTVANTAFGSINGEKGNGQRQFTSGLK